MLEQFKLIIMRCVCGRTTPRGINNTVNHKRFRFLAISILVTLCVTFTLYYENIVIKPNGSWRSNTEFDSEPVESRQNQESRKIAKKILYWNKFFSQKHFNFGVGVEPFLGCAVNNCQIWDKEDGVPPFPAEEFDAIIFHGLHPNEIDKNKPSKRSSHQRYIFYLLESPQHFPINLRHLANFFNWTITYRKDSDIYTPYGFISTDSNPSRTPVKWLEANYDYLSKEYKHNKTNPIAWMVSDCKTPGKREDYVKKLSKFIPVDVFGRCGNLTCERSKTNDICYRMLENNYFFYLAFENSLCKEYVTEKLFHYMAYDIVPVVYGHADYKDHAPPMSYIDYSDFSGPQELAEYLHFLIDNPEEYRKFFWWKSYYKSDYTYGKNVMCTLCEMLNDEAQPPRVYEDIHHWWTNSKLCREPDKF